MEDALTGGLYEIVVGTVLDDVWAHWFSDLDLRPDGNNTLLSGAVPDQSALHGVLARLRDLGIPILTVRRIAEAPD